MSSNEIKRILKECKNIAVVGLSRDPNKDSHRVAAYMKKNGYRIIPVNPFADEVLGEKSYDSLPDIPKEIQKELNIVDIFRSTEDVPPIVEQAVKLREKYGRPSVVWMQLGIVNNNAARYAKKSGLIVVMDKCLMEEHKKVSKDSSKQSRPKAATQ